jgi:hypothetical protein
MRRMSQLLPPRPQQQRRGRRRWRQRREEAAEVRSEDLWRMSASTTRGSR